MAAQPPSIDSRDIDAILAQARRLVPFYTPEWAVNEDTGAGAALLRIVAKLLEGMIQRLNEVPRRNFVAFLNMLGVQLLPAQPARVPLTFTLSTGATAPAVIPPRSQAVANPPDGGDPIVFETERAILATPARLVGLLSVVPEKDAIFDHSMALAPEAGKPVFSELFVDAAANLQEHSLYLAHSKLFDLAAEADLTLRLVAAPYGSDVQTLGTDLSWEWWNEDHWVPSSVAGFKEAIDDFPAVTSLAGVFSKDEAERIDVTDDVESDKRFPDAGVLLIDEEVIGYGAKQGSAFSDLRRALPVTGGTAANNHSAGAVVRAIDASLTVLANAAEGGSMAGQQVVNRQLHKGFAGKLGKTKVNGIDNIWLRARTLRSQPLAASPLRRLTLDTVQIGAAATAVPPDALFHNDVPLVLDADKRIYPFGRRPRLLDTFYIASGDAFSKAGSEVCIGFDAQPGGIGSISIRQVQGIGSTFEQRLVANGIATVDQLLNTDVESLAQLLGTPLLRAQNILEAAQKEFYDKTGILRAIATVRGAAPMRAAVEPEEELTLSWEYWDGKGWRDVPGLVDGTSKLRQPGSVTFTCPSDMAVTAVNGKENRWLRARIVAGDYGQERFTVGDNGTVTSDTSQIRPPVVSRLEVGYEPSLANLEACLIYNNLDFVDVTQAAATANTFFQPFQTMDDAFQALYLGFDVPPTDGPISVFFSLAEQEYTKQNLPRVVWEYFRKRAGEDPGAWMRLDAEDGTANLTQSGAISFLSPPDLAPAPRFGQAWAWIRAVDTDNRFVPAAEALGKALAAAKTDAARWAKLNGSASGGQKTTAAHALALVSALRTLAASTASSSRSGSVIAGAAPQSRPVPSGSRSELSEETPANQAGIDLERTREDVLRSRDCAIPPCPDEVESFHPGFAARALLTDPPAPVLQGVYLNTAWAIQAETVRDEILGSGTGVAGQKVDLTKFPVIDEQVWVDELATLSEGERRDLSAGQPVQVRETKDDQGNLTEFWVRWLPVADLLAAAPADRVYLIDRTFGLVEFGDGVHGAAPPVGRDNVRAVYQAGGGSRGNLPAGSITTLRTTIPFVDAVANPEASGGGSDTETLDLALDRGPQVVKHRGRAVTASDFEWLARESSRGVARVKCLPGVNDRGDTETNWVMVIIVPGTPDPRPSPSPRLRQSVEQYLRSRAANVVAFPEQVRVSGPVYVEVTVAADIFPVTIDLAPDVTSHALQRLGQFLHPLTGGYSGEGWEFGRLPCLSDFYSLLEGIAGVDHVEHVTMSLQAITPAGATLGASRLVTEDRTVDATMPEYALVAGGDHRITVRALSG